MKNLHEEVKKNLNNSNQGYKERSNGTSKEFFFPIGTYSKMKMKKFGPCKILKKLIVEMPLNLNCPKIWIFHLFSTFQTSMIILNLIKR